MKKEPQITRYYDDEEEALIKLTEADDFVPESILTAENLAELQEAARNTISEATTKVSIRMPQTDLARLKAQAMREGIPYQTWIKSILHKSVTQ